MMMLLLPILLPAKWIVRLLSWSGKTGKKLICPRTEKAAQADESLVLNLFYLEECSIADIAQITEMTPSNIKVKLFRGRKHFYETLQLMMQNETANVL